MLYLHNAKPVGPLSPQYVQGLYIPAGLLLAGTFAVKQSFLPYAAVLVVALAGYQIYFNQAVKTLNPKEFQEFKLIKKNVLSHNTAIYRFALPSPRSILGLPIGQHISIKAQINGEKCVRSYTPISSDDDRGFFELLIKSYPTGNISKLLGEMKIGDKLDFQGPKGAMVYEQNMDRHLGMIAGGTGITPMLQIIRAIIKNRPRNGGNDRTEVDLLFANVNPEDILLKDDLDKLAAEDDGFRVHYVLNNPPEGWKGGVGFVTADMIREKLPPPAVDVQVLVCGPPPMVKAMKTATESLGFEKARTISKLQDQVFCF